MREPRWAWRSSRAKLCSALWTLLKSLVPILRATEEHWKVLFRQAEQPEFYFFKRLQKYLGGEWTMEHQGWKWGDQVRGWAIMKVRENGRCGPEWPNQGTYSQWINQQGITQHESSKYAWLALLIILKEDSSSASHLSFWQPSFCPMIKNSNLMELS